MTTKRAAGSNRVPRRNRTNSRGTRPEHHDLEEPAAKHRDEMHGDRIALCQLPDEQLLALFSEIGETVNSRMLKARPVLNSWPTVLNYLRSVMAFQPREQFRVLFLDKGNNLIADEVQHHGTVDHVPVYPREILRRAIELDATAVILAHNHPSGDSTPSRADIDMTKAVIEACRVLGIAVHDHVIIAKQGNTSLKQLGLM